MLAMMMTTRTISQEKVSVFAGKIPEMRVEYIVSHTHTIYYYVLTLLPDRYLENFTPPRFTISMTAAEPVAREKNFECQGQNPSIYRDRDENE